LGPIFTDFLFNVEKPIPVFLLFHTLIAGFDACFFDLSCKNGWQPALKYTGKWHNRLAFSGPGSIVSSWCALSKQGKVFTNTHMLSSVKELSACHCWGNCGPSPALMLAAPYTKVRHCAFKPGGADSFGVIG